MSQPTPTRRRGFTLTELLVVISIIAILVALTSVAVVRALSTARQTGMKTELDQIDMALKSYKERYGAYPPCNLAWNHPIPAEQTIIQNRIRQHVATAFPRYDLNSLPNDLAAAGLDLVTFRPDQALVFWLRGFSPNPMTPFLSPGNQQLVNGTPTGPAINPAPLFEFDTTRLIAKSHDGVTDPAPSYFPNNVKAAGTQIPAAVFPIWDAGTPYVYFDAGNYQYAPPVIGGPDEAEPVVFNDMANRVYPDAGVAAPYWHDQNGNGHTNQMTPSDANENWANPDSFQLIASGLDAKYGDENMALGDDARLYPTGTNYDLTNLADDDNVTNFAGVARLGDDKP